MDLFEYKGLSEDSNDLGFIDILGFIHVCVFPCYINHDWTLNHI